MMFDGVHFEARLPHQWLDAPRQSAFEAARYLHVLAAMEQPHADEVAEHEAKLDLQLLWLARLVTPALPPAARFRIGIEHVQWQQAEPLVPGSYGWLGFCPSDTLPYLLTLPAQVVQCEAQAREHCITARWQIHDELLKEAFERMVFRHHREAIRREREAGA